MARGQSLWDRVWAKVTMPPQPLTDCWHWNGARSLKRGGARRPVIQTGARGSKIVLVARQVCEWYQGPAPSVDHQAGHTCPGGENALCVSPHHLQWMTPLENQHYKAKYKAGRCITPEDGPLDGNTSP